MQSKPAKLFLSAYDENEVTLRLDVVTEAFWNDTEDVGEIIERIRDASAHMRRTNTPAIIPIIHCRSLVVFIETLLFCDKVEEVSYVTFITEVLRVTGWVPVDTCATFAAAYCGGAAVETAVPQDKESESVEPDDSTDDDFGFTIECETTAYKPPRFLLYARAAIDGMLILHKALAERDADSTDPHTPE